MHTIYIFISKRKVKLYKNISYTAKEIWVSESLCKMCNCDLLWKFHENRLSPWDAVPKENIFYDTWSGRILKGFPVSIHNVLQIKTECSQNLICSFGHIFYGPIILNSALVYYAFCDKKWKISNISRNLVKLIKP